MIQLLSRQASANTTAARWRQQYPKGRYADKDAIYEALVALGPTPNPDAVDAVIGNGSWTGLSDCDACDGKDTGIVMIGQEPDYESRTAWVCVDCLRKALALVTTSQGAANEQR